MLNVIIFHVLVKIILICSFCLMLVFKLINHILFWTTEILNLVNIFPNLLEYVLQTWFFEDLGHMHFKWFQFLKNGSACSSNDAYFWGAGKRVSHLIPFFEAWENTQFKWSHFWGAGTCVLQKRSREHLRLVLMMIKILALINSGADTDIYLERQHWKN